MAIIKGYEKQAVFLLTMMDKLGILEQSTQMKMLDVGCGSGELVHYFVSLGYDMYGCDIKSHWGETSQVDIDRLATIPLTPYRLPFEENTFDVVVSNGVLEHVQNKNELLSEIHRVLKVNGHSMHIFPSKWYLPVEPHIYVPLLNVFWPSCPKWWLALWALLGVRNKFQHDKSWRQVTEDNLEFCLHGISYWSNRKYRALSMKIFGNYYAPMEIYIQYGYGGVSKLLRKLPFRRFFAWIAGEIRMNFMVHRKLHNTEMNEVV